jgi:cytochrome c peroxidase
MSSLILVRRASALAAALVLIGCGGGGGDDDAARAAAAANPTTEPVRPTVAANPTTEPVPKPDDHDEQAQHVRETHEQQALLEHGLPALVGFRRPELSLLDVFKGKRLFERETFDGNGRTCLTCHSRESGTVSPHDAQRRFADNPHDPLFIADGSDDGQGNGATRMLKDATVLVRLPLPDNVSLVNDPLARSVVLRRGVPSTLNTPALDETLMLDGRHSSLVAQARGAIGDHAQARREPRADELLQIAAFQHTPQFFSSFTMLKFAYAGAKPQLPSGRTEAEKRGRRFFIDAAPSGDFKTGLCAGCHSGPMLNETNEFIPAPPFARGGRFQSVAVSEFNDAGNPVLQWRFNNPDGTVTEFASPDPGRALITGDARDATTRNAFKIPSLWGAPRTAPYFHDNSAKTLDDVARHYARFFKLVSPIDLTEQDQQDMVAYMKLLR